MNLTRLSSPSDTSRKSVRIPTLHSFLTRLIWLCVLPLVLLAVYLAGTYVHALQTNRDREASDRARDLATSLDRDLGARMAALLALAASPLMDDPPRLKEFYREAQGFRESFSGHVILADPSMQMLFNTRLPFGAVLPKLPRPRGNAAAPAALTTGKPAVGDMFFGPIAQEPLVAVAAPVIRKGRTRALLLSIIEARQFQQRLDELALPAGWSVAVLDGKDEVMARRSAKDMESGPAGADPPGRFVAKLAVSHWSVVLEIPRGTYLAPVVTAMAALAAAILAVTLVSVLGGRLAGRRLARSVATLTEKRSPGGSHPVIAEIETARTMLDDAAAARDASEEALSESEARFRATFEQAAVGIAHLAPDGRWLRVNQKLCDMVGYSREELLTKTFQDITHPGDLAADLGFVRRVLADEIKVYSLEKRYVRKDGSLVWINLTVSLVRDDLGEPKYFISVIEDITKRKRSEEALQVSEERFRTTLETMMEGCQIISRDWRYVYVNGAAARHGRRTREELLGRSMLECYPGIDKTELFSHLRRCMEERVPHRMENEFTFPDGSKGWFDLSIEPVPDGIFILSIDMTERKKLEVQLRQAQKMEAIGLLAGGVAHDFNNILTAIIGYAHITLMQMQENDPLRHYIAQVLESSNRATALTQSLLAFSRKQPVSLAVIDLNDVIKKFEKFLHRLLREDIALETVCARDPLAVMADRGQIEQVIMNLATNARDAMPGGGRLIIETRPVTLDQEFIAAHGYGKAGEYALVLVSDTGTGMDAHTRSKLFEPFFTTKEQGKGTGLGLSTVYGIVKKHDGFINVYSEPGKGATFKIYLPLVRAAVEAERRKTAEPVPLRGGTETILVAEDDASLRKLNNVTLNHFGYSVIEAVDGADAVAKFAENREKIQLVILDGIMPKMNGKEAFREIKAMNPGVKCIFMSGHAEDVFTKGGAPGGEAEFVLKPVSPAALLKKIREVLDGEKPSPP